MVASSEKLEAALIEGTCHVFALDPDATSVNKVRKHVEEAHHLEDGFFTGEEWKTRSKNLIKEYVSKLLDGWVPEPTKDSKSRNGTKRHVSEEGDEGDEGSPKRQKQSEGSKAAAKRKKSPPKKAKSRRKAERVISDQESGHDDDQSQSHDEVDEAGEDAKPLAKAATSEPAVDEEEEYSDVIDEPPKPKKKKTESKAAASATSSKPASKQAGAANAAAASSTSDNPHETEMKKLQSQLIKCGIRKLWHNELKRYGDDARAKIRHLKKMLADVGMDGRFSEAKAREIKENRELLADAEAAQEMNRLWGMHAGGRASRSKVKTMKLDDSDLSDEADETGNAGGRRASDGDDDDGESTSFAARRRRAQADLAFLGDDDSDSD